MRPRNHEFPDTPLYVPIRHASGLTGLDEELIIDNTLWADDDDPGPDIRCKFVFGRLLVNLADCLGIVHDPGPGPPRKSDPAD